ncbi:MAG TPA: type VI secretion system baseplate subunit TssK [Longimicrobiales bacterium]|nr:type VI secretion system baseplate subunit TssK [Longimicrobiales bacterium]
MRSVSRVVWSEGMHLAQHHFQVQNAYFEQLTATALRDLVPGGYGLLSCQLDGEALLNGTVSIIGARGIMPDGLPFAFPDDPAPMPLAIGEMFSPTQPTHRVLLAVPEEVAGRANCVLEAAVHGAELRYTAVARTVPDDNTGEEPRPVQFARKNFRLLLDNQPAEGLVTLPLARIQRDGAGHFIYDPTFIGPCLRITANRRLREMVGRITEMLEVRAAAVLAERQGGGDAAGEYAPREIVGFWFLHALHGAIPVLRHWASTGAAHPEQLYLRLAQLAGALCTFSLTSHPRDLPPYDHDEPEPCFTALERHIRQHLDVVMPADAVSLPVQAVAESFYAAPVRDARCLDPGARWYLGVRANLPSGELVARTTRLVKLCSSRFIARLVKEAYPGLGIDPVPAPPPELAPRLGMQYFAIGRTEPCWKAIVDSGEVGLYVPGAIPQPELELKVVLERG